MAKQVNILVDQGATFTKIVDVTNEDGTPFDLTGFSASSQMRKSYFTNTSHEITAEVEGDPTNGQVKLTLLPSVTNSIRAGRYVYDLEVHNDSDPDVVIRVIEGIVTLTPQVTRPVV